MFQFMHAYPYLETCVQQYMTLGAVEAGSPEKSSGTVAVFTTSGNNGVDEIDGVPVDEVLGGAAPVSGPSRR
jgi:hypothetical protein